MDNLEFLKRDEMFGQEMPEQVTKGYEFTEFSAEEIKRSYQAAGIQEDDYRKFDETTGMMKDAVRSMDTSEEEYRVRKARTMAMNNMKMAHHSMMEIKTNVVNSGSMSKEMEDICDGIDSITEQLNKTVNCTREVEGQTVFFPAKYRAYIGEIIGAYDYAIDKADYYIGNKSPRTERGKQRLNFVIKFKNYLEHEREALSANAQASESSMPLFYATHVTGSDILFNVRAEMIDKLKNEGGGTTGTSQSYISNGKKYYYKEDKKVEENSISGIESAQTFLLTLYKTPEHLRTDADNYKEKIAISVVELLDLFEESPLFIHDLLISYANNVIDYEGFFNNVYGQIRSSGHTPERANEITNLLRERLNKDEVDTKEYRAALLQVVKYNTASSIANYNSIETGRRLGVRNVASSRVAELLGGKGCIANSKTVVFTDEKGAIKTGNCMEEVKGYYISKLVKIYHKVEFTGKAKRMIANMQFIDFICGQMDRHAGNYIVDGDYIDGVYYVDSVVGIDNDMSFGTFSYNDIKKGSNRLAGPESGGKFAMKKISRDMYQRIMQTKPATLKYALADLGLSTTEFGALVNRLKGMQNYLSNAYKKFGDDFIVEDDDEWDELSAQEIYSGTGRYLREEDGEPMYMSVFAGIKTSIEKHNGTCHTL